MVGPVRYSIRLLNFAASRSVTAAVVAGVLLASCGDTFIDRAYRDTSDWLNEIPEVPPPNPWRLSKQPGPTDVPYPNLGDVPSRPADLPTPEQIQARIETLQREAAAAEAPAAGAGTGDGKRPSARSLGAPPPAQVEPLEIPGVGMVGR
jgi:hypothetical protein